MIYLPFVANGSQASLTVCTYNVGYNGDSWGLTAAQRTARILAQLHERGAEIVALQEVIHRGDMAEVGAFGGSMPGWNVYTEPHNATNHYSNMILSAFPIVQGSERTHTIFSRNGRNDRVNLSVQLRTPLGLLRVWCIHTRFEEPDEGTLQLLQGVKLIAESEPGTPYIIMGDFNTQRKNVLSIARSVGLAVQDATNVGRIDHILTGAPLEIAGQACVARPTVPGEHDPIFAETGAT